MHTTEDQDTLNSVTPNVAKFLLKEENRIYDTLLAVTLTFCTLFGLPGNIISLMYFYSAKRKDFARLIYIIVCSIDISICVIQIPVMISLYKIRQPIIMRENIFCVGWAVVFYYLQLMSMFLVMLLSASRSIKLIFLHSKISKKILIISFLVYSGFIITRFIMIMLFGGDKFFGYSRPAVYCYYNLNEKPFSYIDQITHVVCVICPPVIATISFVMFIVMIFQRSRGLKTNKRRQKAPVTMATFTFLFLACNLPCLLNNILWLLTELWDDYPEPFYSNTFMFFYSWLISDVLCTVLNATLNPVVYFCRVTPLKDWLKSYIV